LEQYSLFVETVRRHIAVDKEHGFENAIKECIRRGILREYLQRKSKEVLNMLIGEYDYATDIAVQRAEEREMGYTEGKLETAKMLKQLGDPIQKIMQVTGLDKIEIERL
jgi:hypothetical protein